MSVKELYNMLTVEFQPHLYSYYDQHSRHTITDIINDNKYESFFTGHIEQYMLNYLAICITRDDARELMHRYIINYDVLIKNKFFISSIFIADDIIMLKKYKYHEQVNMIRLCLNLNHIENNTCINTKLLWYMAPLCDYTIPEWNKYQAKIATHYTNKTIIAVHVNRLIKYDQSLRNTWIMSCIFI